MTPSASLLWRHFGWPMTTDTPQTHVVLNIAKKVHHRRICIKFSDTCNVNGSTEHLGDHMWCQMRLYRLRLSESLKMPIRGFKWILWGFYSTNQIRSGNNGLPKKHILARKHVIWRTGRQIQFAGASSAWYQVQKKKKFKTWSVTCSPRPPTFNLSINNRLIHKMTNAFWHTMLPHTVKHYILVT